MLGNRKKKVTSRIDTLVGQQSVMNGDISFSGGLHVDGRIIGNVTAPDDSESVLTLSENGSIEGEVRVPHIILNGRIAGNVFACERVELAPKAQVTGDVFYNLIEMAMGAEVNGSLVHQASEAKRPAVEKTDIQEPTVKIADANS
jgi:cytoskeletal protein CcmA (bactofilin family)